ncbi:MAG: cytidylate kinase-like family protein [Magnetococcales bacterium]|nr:cytidylate kinase-like family protein [Magnetococcales bacterium]
MGNKNLGLIQSIVGAGLFAESSETPGSGEYRFPVVTLSRQFGAGGTEIARLLAERLQVPLYDRELLHNIIKVAKSDKHLMERLDERVTNLWDDFVHAFLSKKGTNKEQYLRNLTRVLLGILRSGGVIVGRGAHILLVRYPVLRVKITASADTTIKRVSERLDIKKVKARALIERTNMERDGFVDRLKKRYPSDKEEFDLVINTDLFDPPAAVELILLAMGKAGLAIAPPKVAVVENEPGVEGNIGLTMDSSEG